MQHIIELACKDDYKNIKRGFEWPKIPKFAVITGENGSGKSTLLQGIKSGKFVINNHQPLQAVIELYSSFRLNGGGYNSSFVKEIDHEEVLLSKHTLETDNANVNNIFNRMLFEARQYPRLMPIVSAITFEDFISKNFSLFDENQQEFLNRWRNGLNLDSYHKHFERNGMSEEKFYLSTHDEIKQWFSGLEDKNFTSRKTIFDENALISIFGDYYIRRSNKKEDIEDNYPNITIEEVNRLTDEEIGVNPLVKINQLLKQVYSKYTLSIRHDNSNQPKVICKDLKGISVPLNELSTGEQIIISLYMWQYDKNPLHSMIFLFDEPDAHLNPKMAKMLIDVLKNTIVKKFDCQVIMTTHSLSTVAQCDEGELFYMECGTISEIKKLDCMEKLSGGVLIDEMKNILETIIESSKIVFVEGESDKAHIEKYFQLSNQRQPFRIFNSKSATKMQHYAMVISKLKKNLISKCLFLCDDDREGRKAQTEVSKYKMQTMLVSRGQNHKGGDFVIEDCYDTSITSKYASISVDQWDKALKEGFSKESFALNEMQGIGILINEIKKELKIP